MVPIRAAVAGQAARASRRAEPTTDEDRLLEDDDDGPAQYQFRPATTPLRGGVIAAAGFCAGAGFIVDRHSQDYL